MKGKNYELDLRLDQHAKKEDSMKKRFISLMLVFAMALSLSVSAGAATSTEGVFEWSLKALFDVRVDSSDMNMAEELLSDIENVPDEVKAEICKEIALLDAMGIFSVGKGKITKITVDSDTDQSNEKSITYTMDYGAICEDISFLRLNENAIEVLVSDDNSTSTMLIGNDGTMIVDGEKVKVTYTQNVDTVDIMAARSSDTFFQTTCPYGSSADYSRYLSSKSSADIQMAEAHRNTKFTVASAIVGAALTALGLGAAGAVAVTFTSALWNYLRDSAPEAHGLSFKADRYWHKNSTNASGGYISAIGRYVTKWDIQWFAKENYRGAKKNVTEYEIKVIY